MKFRSAALAFAAVATVVTSAYAATSFDPSTGTGFAGKGDVQIPFGWSNSQLQAQAENVAFTYTKHEQYDVVCESTVGRRVRQKTKTSMDHLWSSVVKDTRTNKRGAVTGFHLTGTSSTIVNEGEGCSTTERFISETLVGTNEHLTASHAASGNSAVIWQNGMSVQL